MNKIENDLIKTIYKTNNVNQRYLSKTLGYSLGIVNKSLKKIKDNGYLDSNYQLTDFSLDLINKNKPKNAIILAAGMGLRLTPINQDLPKALIHVKNQTLIENIIHKLKEQEINDIYVVIGYMKEKFDYLIDLYDVKLIVNNNYSIMNNLYSLYLARKHINNTYIIPCDLYIDYNPFNQIELNSWYLVDNEKEESYYKKNKDGIMKHKTKKVLDYKPIGISYINAEDSLKVIELFQSIDKSLFYKNKIFWEDYIIENNISLFYEMNKGYIKEINTFEELRDVDATSKSLNTEIIDIITSSLNVTIQDIGNIKLSKKGMTNKSFIFEAKNKKYMMRIPGEGTDQLINRKEEGDVYNVISPYHLSDDVIYFNKNNGYKITQFIENSRVCNMYDLDDLNLVMNLLRKFHDSDLKVHHYFDIFEKIEFYESLRNGKKSLYSDYDQTKKKVYQLKNIIGQCPKHISLTHIDAVPDNFLIYEENKEIKVKLIDWEYASMQDTDVDLAMFCIYSMYERKDVDQLIDIYYQGNCPKIIRLKIYCYIAVCGFLWSNWCEYKYLLGIEFGEYSLAQYRYAKDYYKIIMNEFKNIEGIDYV